MIDFSSKKSRLLTLLLKFSNVKNSSGIFISKGSRIKKNTVIGSGTRINGKITIKGSGQVNVGKYCAIGEDIKIISSNHSTALVNQQYALQKKIGLSRSGTDDKTGVTIGHNVWIGDNVIILPGVNIGNGAVLAAGSVITKEVAPYSIVGGVPASHIKYRFSEDKIAEIENTQWWDWSIDKMKENKNFFE